MSKSVPRKNPKKGSIKPPIVTRVRARTKLELIARLDLLIFKKKHRTTLRANQTATNKENSDIGYLIKRRYEFLSTLSAIDLPRNNPKLIKNWIDAQIYFYSRKYMSKDIANALKLPNIKSKIDLKSIYDQTWKKKGIDIESELVSAGLFYDDLEHDVNSALSNAFNYQLKKELKPMMGVINKKLSKFANGQKTIKDIVDQLPRIARIFAGVGMELPKDSSREIKGFFANFSYVPFATAMYEALTPKMALKTFVEMYHEVKNKDLQLEDVERLVDKFKVTGFYVKGNKRIHGGFGGMRSPKRSLLHEFVHYILEVNGSIRTKSEGSVEYITNLLYLHLFPAEFESKILPNRDRYFEILEEFDPDFKEKPVYHNSFNLVNEEHSLIPYVRGQYEAIYFYLKNKARLGKNLIIDEIKKVI